MGAASVVLGLSLATFNAVPSDFGNPKTRRKGKPFPFHAWHGHLESFSECLVSIVVSVIRAGLRGASHPQSAFKGPWHPVRRF
jgi:hypothetical protein